MGIFFDPSSSRTQVWSDGGGTQSCYIATLICKGDLPKPDIAVMVDTEREKPETFEYHEKYVIPALNAVGVTLNIIKKSDYATVDLTSKNGKTILLPAFTNQSGEIGKLPTYCSGEWKRDAISRYLRERGVKQSDMWMGFSLDEMRRVKRDRKQWLRKLYPLIELRKTRSACIAGVIDFGWPRPPRSACWMCPNQCHSEWKDMRESRPEDFALAVAFERDELHSRDSQMFLHESCVPLGQVDWDARMPSAFEPGCESGLCFV
jgi:hypothetical protein